MSSLKDHMHDLAARFIINLPQEELESFERIFFQIEGAYWYYEDFLREKFTFLPHFRKLKQFAESMFEYCTFLAPYKPQLEEIVKKFSEYKSKVPVCGAIILNKPMDKVILVQGYGTKSWGFPKGKINKDEPFLDCAIREVFEETGFDITDHTNEVDYIEMTLFSHSARLYIARDVDERTVFKTQTRKEISAIQWHQLKDLPTTGKVAEGRYFGVAPFVKRLQTWIRTHRSSKSQQPVPSKKEQPKPAPTATPVQQPASSHPSQPLQQHLIPHPIIPVPLSVIEQRMGVQAPRPQPPQSVPVSEPIQHFFHSPYSPYIPVTTHSQPPLSQRPSSQQEGLFRFDRGPILAALYGRSN